MKKNLRSVRRSPAHIHQPQPAIQRGLGAFTLIEVMVSMVVLSIMLLLIANIIGTTQRSWSAAAARLSQFREARIAFDTITRNLKQATLNTYRDYYYESTQSNAPKENEPTESPDSYRRYSDLGFRCGPAATLVSSAGDEGTVAGGHAIFFQAPLGVTQTAKYENLKNLLCVRGYFLLFGSDTNYQPKGLAERLKPRNRIRFIEYQPPAEMNTAYKDGAKVKDAEIKDSSWIEIKKPESSGTSGGSSSTEAPPESFLRPVSENIVALIISPRLSAGEEDVTSGGSKVDPISIAPNYEYDSTVAKNITASNPEGTKHLLPPVVMVTMVAVDDASMDKLVETLGSSGETVDVLKSASAGFTSATDYAKDLEMVKEFLNGKGASSVKYNYRIFEAAVTIPASRWVN